MKLNSLRQRISLTIIALELILLAAVLWFTLSSSYSGITRQIEATDQVIIKNLSELGRIAILTDQYSDLQPFLKIATEDPHVLRVVLTNIDNVVYASSDFNDLGIQLSEPVADSPPDGDSYSRSINIENQTGTIGKLRVYFSNATYTAAFTESLLLGIIIAVCGTLVIIFTSLMLGNLLTRNLKALSDVAAQYTQGNFNVKAPVEGEDETRNLGRSLNRMAEEVSQSLEALKESEKSFRTIFNEANDAIFLIDPATDRIVNVNVKACELLDYEYQALLKTPVSVIHSDEMTTMKEFVSEVMKKGAAKTDSLTCLTRTGKRFIAGISASKITLDGKYLMLAQVRDISERKAFEEQLAASERLFREMVNALPISICQTDLYGNASFVNTLWLQQTGMTLEASMGHGWHNGLHPDDREATLALLKKNAYKKEPWELEYRFQSSDGETRSLIGKVVAIFDEDERIVGYLGANLDVTDYKKTEFALRRSQKMDAIGQLSGGIAHDFNNLLSAILGNIELLELRTELDTKSQKRIDTIKRSSLRAAKLTKQLLGFSRKEVQRAIATDINQVVKNIQNLISQSLTPQVEVEYKLSDDLWLTNIDSGEFEDVMINIALNARDAMQGRGRLTIETRNTTLDESYCKINPDVKAGEFIELAISDDGCGITQDQMEHIFEPFYTTKEQGKGTGLGLSMVFGFVKRVNGNVKVYSEPEIGTTIRLYLPRAEGIERRVASRDIEHAKNAELPRGNESVLVVDDEVQLLELIEETLIEQGFTVFTAENASLAMQVLQREPGIKLMVSDVVMPGEMNGYELAEKACSLYPDLQVLLTSGYTEKAIARNGQAKFNSNLLSKPYTMRELITRLKNMVAKS